ncbi:Uncharacterised protein [Klebsiella pneumoniae]|nr:Uncharacterised protein [Klebsiella pneumoniae]
MSLINLLHECISRGQEMTQAIAIAHLVMIARGSPYHSSLGDNRRLLI